MASFLSYEQALATVLGACAPVGTERIPLAAARGRVLALAPAVGDPIPPFANSAMDGFAVAARDVPARGGRLPLGAPVPAGTAPPPLRSGHAVPIGTGGAIPAGADAVVPVEDAVTDGATVTFGGAVAVGAHVRPAGSDLPSGPSPLRTGVPLDPADGALLATVGATEVEVFRRPLVAILATGQELVPPDRAPGPAQIRDSNSTALAWAIARLGARVEMLGIAPDEYGPLREHLERALDADVVVTSAGVSVGERDLVRRALDDLGVEARFWGVDMKPGKPVAFGMAGTTPVLSLPGNPASTLVASALIAEPAVRRRGGWASPGPAFEHATATGAWPAPERRLHAVRCARFEDGARATVTPTGDQRSHRIGSMVGADALALVEPGRQVAPGESVRVTRL